MKAHTKPSAVVVTHTAQISAITRAATVCADMAKAKADSVIALRKEISAFIKAGGKLGKSAATCPNCKAFLAGMKQRGIKPTTAANYLSALRTFAKNPKGEFNLNPSRAKSGKGGKGRRMPSATSYSSTGEVLDALYKAIQVIQERAGSDLWVKALAASVDGLDDVLADFQSAQDPARPSDEDAADAAAMAA